MKVSQNMTIHIASSTIVKILLILLGFYAVFLLRDIAMVLLASIVIASAVEPAAKWFGKVKIPRIPAVVIIYAVLLTLFFSVFYFFLPPLVNDVANILRSFPEYVARINEVGPLPGVGTLSVGEVQQTFSTNDLLTNLRDITGQVSGGFVNTITVVFGGILSFILVIVISFYLAVQERGIENFLRLVTPVKHEEYAIRLWYRTQRKIGQWMQGQLLLAALIGILVFLGLSILEVENALLLAVLAAMFEVIPVFGPILAAVPAVVFGFLDSVSLGVMVLGLYVIIQQFENHLIYPLVVRKVIGVSPIMVVLSLVVGAKLAGFLGVLLAVPVAAVIMEFADDLAKGKHGARAKLDRNVKEGQDAETSDVHV